MKIAYLIAAHTDPKHLRRLVDSLLIEGITDFYIHIDKKVDIEDYQRKAKIVRPSVTWIKERFITQWGGILYAGIRKH